MANPPDASVHIPAYYKILGLQTTCTTEDIEKAWNKMKDKLPASSLKFKELQNAYNTLKDPQKRVMYNPFNLDTLHFDSKFFFTDEVLQNQSVKNYEKHLLNRNPQDVCKEVEVTLDDFFKGRTIKVDLKRNILCKSCSGLGHDALICSHCGNFGQEQPCSKCHSMILLPKPCPDCNGSKMITQEDNTFVVLEKGMFDGEYIKCAERNVSGSKTPAAYIVLRQKPHPIFKRFGPDLYMTKKIGINEALCGARFVVTHLDGRNLLVSSETVLSPGCKRIVKGEGMPVYKSDHDRGDLIIFFQVEMPENLNDMNIDVKEIEALLPERKSFSVADHPEAEEYKLTDLDPNHKCHSHHRKETYDDDKHRVELPPNPQQRCTHQ